MQTTTTKEYTINNYYDQRIKKLEYDKKDKLKKQDEWIEKMKEHKKEQLEKKIQRKINQIEKDRARKIKNITLVQKWKAPKEKKKKPKTESRYMNKADWYFSRVVRSIWAFQENGERYNYDYTGKLKVRIKDLTCGHYITRWVYTLRYDLNNCLPQTKWQNRAEHLNPSLKTQFRNILIATRGIEVVKMIDQKHNERNKSENKKVIMKEEYEKRKAEYQKVKHMYWE